MKKYYALFLSGESYIEKCIVLLKHVSNPRSKSLPHITLRLFDEQDDKLEYIKKIKYFFQSPQKCIAICGGWCYNKEKKRKKENFTLIPWPTNWLISIKRSSGAVWTIEILSIWIYWVTMMSWMENLMVIKFFYYGISPNPVTTHLPPIFLAAAGGLLYNFPLTAKVVEWPPSRLAALYAPYFVNTSIIFFSVAPLM